MSLNKYPNLIYSSITHSKKTSSLSIELRVRMRAVSPGAYLAIR